MTIAAPVSPRAILIPRTTGEIETRSRGAGRSDAGDETHSGSEDVDPHGVHV